MARAPSTAGNIAAALSGAALRFVERRCYNTAAAAMAVPKRASAAATEENTAGSVEADCSKSNPSRPSPSPPPAWEPDPVKGYYRPGNRCLEADSPEAMLSRKPSQV